MAGDGTRNLQLEPFEPDAAYPWLAERVGTTAIARSATDPRWLVSLHFPAERLPREALERISIEGIEITTRDRSVWDSYVVPHELHRLVGADTFVWGGDLNSDPRMDDYPRTFLGGNRRMFENYRLAGARDLRTRFHDDYQQTFFAPRRRAYQIDHVFGDEATERRVTGWQVDAAVASGGYSDQAPIIVDLASV